MRYTLPDSRRWGVLAAMTLALGMLTIDVTVVRVALPTIQRELDLSDVTQQWVVNAYLLTLGVFVIAGGRAGDLLGRRRVFLAGMLGFAGGSVLCGVAVSSAMLVAARAVQGMGAAIMTPGTMSIVTDAYSGPFLGRAIGILTGTAAVGLSLGPLLGGALTQFAGWRWIFLINVPLATVAAVLVVTAVPRSHSERAPPIDWPGLVTLGAGLTALTLGLMQAPVWGPGSAATIGLLAGAAALFAAWARVESRSRHPLVDLRVLHGASAAANWIGFCSQFVVTGLTVLLAIYLQNVLGHSPLAAGALLLPLTVPLLVGSPLAGRLVDRLGSRRLVTAGMAMLTAGTLGVGLGADGTRYASLLPGLVIFGFGFSLVMTAMTTAVMASAGALDRGMVSGVYNTARNVGATLGVAVMGSLLALLESAGPAAERLAPLERSHVHAVLAGAPSARQALGGLAPPAAEAVEAAARALFDGAFATTMKLSAAIAAAGALVAFLALPRAAGRGRLADHPGIHPGTGGA